MSVNSARALANMLSWPSSTRIRHSLAFPIAPPKTEAMAVVSAVGFSNGLYSQKVIFRRHGLWWWCVRVSMASFLEALQTLKRSMRWPCGKRTCCHSEKDSSSLTRCMGQSRGFGVMGRCI
eukprot:639152-Hanusia_phi.AAC.2